MSQLIHLGQRKNLIFWSDHKEGGKRREFFLYKKNRSREPQSLMQGWGSSAQTLQYAILITSCVLPEHGSLSYLCTPCLKSLQ